MSVEIRLNESEVKEILAKWACNKYNIGTESKDVEIRIDNEENSLSVLIVEPYKYDDY